MNVCFFLLKKGNPGKKKKRIVWLLDWPQFLLPDGQETNFSLGVAAAILGKILSLLSKMED